MGRDAKYYKDALSTEREKYLDNLRRLYNSLS
jgi:hypothetical protein